MIMVKYRFYLEFPNPTPDKVFLTNIVLSIVIFSQNFQYFLITLQQTQKNIFREGKVIKFSEPNSDFFSIS